MTEEDKKRLNKHGQSILKANGFDLEEHQDYYWIKNIAAGYAHYYLYKFNESGMINNADLSIYDQLVNIDSKLGTNASTQLHSCLNQTTRFDIIMVGTFSMISCLLFI